MYIIKFEVLDIKRKGRNMKIYKKEKQDEKNTARKEHK